MCPCDDHILCAPNSRPAFEKKFGISKQLGTMICELAFNHDIAKLTIEIAQPRVVEVVKDNKVTFPDILGTIGELACYVKNLTLFNLWKMDCMFSGGTIGLFTGLSLISVIEIFFWIYKTIKEYLWRGQKNSEQTVDGEAGPVTNVKGSTDPLHGQFVKVLKIRRAASPTKPTSQNLLLHKQEVNHTHRSETSTRMPVAEWLSKQTQKSQGLDST